MADWLILAKRLAVIVAGCWLALFATLYLTQRFLLYVPPVGVVSPVDAGLAGVHEQLLPTADGAAAVAVWHAPAPQGRPTVLYFHGNGGSHGLLASKYQLLRQAGFGVYAMTYRGYPGSSGRPSEAANVADGILAYDTLRGLGVPADRIVLYGESLGTGVAIQVAGARPVAALVLESPYSSIADVAAAHYWYVPVRLALADPYDSVTHVQRVRAPILILHGAQDDVVPIAFARRLHAAVPGHKHMVEYPDAGHVGLLRQGGLAEMQAFVAGATARSGAVARE